MAERKGKQACSEKCRAVLRTKPAFALQIENDIRAKMGVEPRKGPAAAAAAAKPTAGVPVPKAPEKNDDDRKPAKK